MRSLWKLAVVMVVPAIWVVAAWSQEPHRPEGTTIKLMLLRQKSVQKELNISPEVTRKVSEFSDQQSEAFGKTLDLAEGARKNAIAKLKEQNEKFLEDTLTPKQNARLDQIYMQFTALVHLTRPESAKLLKLTDDQVQKLKALHQAHRKDMKELLFDKDVQGRAAKYTKYHDKMRDQILAILTEKQQAQVRGIVGAPFTGEIVFDENIPTKKK
jgi:hypothetical protein